jgi:predicted N-acetyltransferase YhbS
MNIRIDHLFNHPEHIGLVAGWIYNEFWVGKPGYRVEYFEARLREANDPDRIPLSLLAVSDGRPVGTINLIHNDNPKRPDLHPWLAALIVVPEERRRGIGTMLVRALVREAERLGYSDLFLGTDIPAFYERLEAEHYDWATETLQIMRIALRVPHV